MGISNSGIAYDATQCFTTVTNGATDGDYSTVTVSFLRSTGPSSKERVGLTQTVDVPIKQSRTVSVPNNGITVDGLQIQEF